MLSEYTTTRRVGRLSAVAVPQRDAAALGRVADGARLVALCVLIDQQIDHPDAQSDLDALARLTAHLQYTPQQEEALFQQAANAYQIDRGWGLVMARVNPLLVETLWMAQQ